MLSSTTELRLLPATPERVAALAADEESFDPDEREPVRGILAAGSTTRTERIDDEDRPIPLLPDGTHVHRGGVGYYRVRTTLVERVSVPGHRIRVRNVAQSTTAAGAETVPFGDLPRVDREAVVEANPEALDPGESTTRSFDADEFDADASRLAGADGPVRVVYRETPYRVAYEPGDRTERARYRYETTRVAESQDGFLEYADRRYAFEIDRASLSTDAREILDEAADGVYTEEGSLSEAFVDVLERIAANESPEPTVRGGDGRWLCRYDGSQYVAEIEKARVVTEERPYRTAAGPPDDGATTGTPTGTTNATTGETETDG